MMPTDLGWILQILCSDSWQASTPCMLSTLLPVPQVIAPDIEEVAGGGEMSPQLLGWIDVADILRAFLQREPCSRASPAARPPRAFLQREPPKG